MNAQQNQLQHAVEHLDKAATIIYNIEGEPYQDIYDKLQAIFDQIEETNRNLKEII